MCSNGVNAASIDVVEHPNNFFVPDASSTYSSPYYRGAAGDWGYTHGAITEEFTTATLAISAWDVDYTSGEFDEIFVMDDGALVSLGYLQGENDTYSYTEFTLTSSLFDEVETGLEVYMDIDINGNGWLVTLAKSVLSVDGAPIPDADPGVDAVPLPASLPLLAAGFGALGILRRKRRS